MNLQALTIITLVFGMIFFFLQRADPARRNAVQNTGWLFFAFLAVYIWWYSALREAVVGLLIALLLNGIFWLLIGRYNPVHSSDDIRVLGMDD